MTFRVGQKVVCVDASGQVPGWDKVVEGRVYIIRGFTTRPACGYYGPIVEGVVRIHMGVDWPFSTDRFRPIVERKTDISVFTAMLTDKKIGASA